MKIIRVKFNPPAANAIHSKGIKIRRPDRSGDSCLATIDPTSAASIEVGEQELSDFWQECIKQFRKPPTLWAGRRVPHKTDLEFRRVVDPMQFDLTSVEEVLINYPLVGG